MQNLIEQYRHTINVAAQSQSQSQRALRIVGSNSKAFYGRHTQGETLDATAYRGIVSYEPTELVLTARAGTPLAEIEAALAEKRQMLAFEPPHFGAAATLGGCIASGLSGPRRAYAGAVRDYVLGVRMMDGKGAVLNFGGQVMKNVAGYDVSRLLAGSLGTLGLLLEVSLKVLPVPVSETTLRFEMNEGDALAAMNRWAAQPLSLSASCYYDGVLTVRLSGATAAVRAVQAKIGGELVENAADFWRSVREQQHEFFSSDKSLWRLSVPSTAPTIAGEQLIEWGGALRWLRSDESAVSLRTKVAALGGQATVFRSASAHDAPFHPLSPALLQVHQRLKQSFDPHGIFNAGRMYSEF